MSHTPLGATDETQQPSEKLTSAPASDDTSSSSLSSTTSPSTTIKDVVDFDDLMSRIGEIGRYQVAVFVALSLGIVFEGLVILSYVFVAATPGHHCATPELDLLNVTDSVRLNLTVPPDSGGSYSVGEVTYSSCRMYNRSYDGYTMDDVMQILESGNSNTSTIPCRSGWTYDRSVYEQTIVTDWDLVCDKSWMASFAFTVVGLGNIVGATIYGSVTDRFGRKRAYFTAVVVVAATGFGAAFSPNYVVYCVFVFIGSINNILYTTSITLGVEMVGVSWRGHVGTSSNYLWASGYMLVAGLAYAIRSRWLLTTVISILIASMMIFVFFIPESPRWLYTKRRTKQAEKVMTKMTRCNGVEMPQNVIVRTSDSDEEGEGSCLDLVRTSLMRRMTAILCLVWFSCELMYYGISLYIPRFSGDDYLNFFISGLVEIPGYISSQLAVRYVGRRIPLVITLIVAGVALLVTMAIPDDIEWLKMTLTFIGKLCTTASWSTAICYTAELYPTVVRGVGMFTCAVFGNIGIALAPLIGLLGDISLYLPLTIYGVFAIASGLASLLLVETRDRHLVDTIVDKNTVPQLNGSISPSSVTSSSDEEKGANMSAASAAEFVGGGDTNSDKNDEEIDDVATF